MDERNNKANEEAKKTGLDEMGVKEKQEESYQDIQFIEITDMEDADFDDIDTDSRSETEYVGAGTAETDIKETVKAEKQAAEEISAEVEQTQNDEPSTKKRKAGETRTETESEVGELPAGRSTESEKEIKIPKAGRPDTELKNSGETSVVPDKATGEKEGLTGNKKVSDSSGKRGGKLPLSDKKAFIMNPLAVPQVIEEEPYEDHKINDRVEKMNATRKKWKIASGVVGTVVLAVYLTGFAYFSKHFYGDVAINEINVSGLNGAETEQTLDQFYKNYALTMETIDGEQIVIDGDDIDMKIVLNEEFSDSLKKQKPAAWFVHYFKHHDYEIEANASWDQEKLEDLFGTMTILKKKKMVKPKDAYVDVKDDKFVIVDEVLGTTIDKDVFKQVVNDSLTNVQSTLSLYDAGCYKLPEIYAKDESIKTELEQKTAFAQNVIKLKLDDITVEPGLELYNEVLKKDGDTVKVSKDLVAKYVERFADKYDTVGDERLFSTSYDRDVYVLGYSFGYAIDQEETTKALYKALKAGKSASVDVVFSNKGMTMQGDNDIGDTYIEVNLSEQRVFGYKNGTLIVQGDCVSGKESTGNGTSIGLFSIQDKKSPTVLRGQKKAVTKTTTRKGKDGKEEKVTKTTYEYEYESPVTFWMQFNGGIGLHDAAGWRTQYGGSIYYYSGSHGCVNLPYSLAETLYNNFNVGDPVIVYFWDNANRK